MTLRSLNDTTPGGFSRSEDSRFADAYYEAAVTYQKLDKRDDAAGYLKKAKELYEAVGDKQNTKKAEDALKKLGRT